MITEAITKLLAVQDLPEPLPVSPMGVLVDWFEEARKSGKYDDSNAMSLATATPDGVPSVRVVLCKGIEPDIGAIQFFTNYESRKGRELGANPRAASVFHWPHAQRQARMEGVVERLSDEESDAYFKTRPLLSRIGACISRQSEPIESRTQLVEAAVSLSKAAALGQEIRRPSNWGGFRLRLTCVELWSAREGRLHQRVAWRRAMTAPGSEWSHTMLSP